MSRHGRTPPEPDAVAEVYRAAVVAGRPPAQAVMERYDAGRSTASRWIARARSEGLLPPTDGNMHGSAITGEHQPRTARWSSPPVESWLLCAACRTSWPCDRIGGEA